jgi:FkbM family methyltransferase
MNARRIGNAFSGPFLQPVWRRLHRLALHRMNYGRGVLTNDSGEEWVLRYLRRRHEPIRPFVAFDAGANTGAYTELVLAVFGDMAQVYCFEPNEATFALLKSKYRAAGCVRCYDVGLSDKEETLPLYSDGQRSFLASHYRRPGMSMAPAAQVRCTTVDRFCETEGVGTIDLLKMDVEGHELQVLRGASGMIESGRIGHIQFEFGDCNINSRTFFRDFFELLTPRYRIHRIVRRGLAPIDRYDEACEIFKGTNYLAARR